MLRSGEWGSTVRLGVGTSLLWARDRGEGLIEGRELWWVSLGVGSKTQRLGGWPVKLQLSRSCAAACPRGGAVQCSLFPWRRDETREIRDRQQKPKAKRVETSCGFPTEEGKGCRRRHGICRLSLGVHTTVEYVCMYVAYCLLDGKLSSRVGCQIKSV